MIDIINNREYVDWNFLNRYFKTQELNKEGRELLNFRTLHTTLTILVMASSGIYETLFLLEFLTISQLGISIAIVSVITFSLDFPTGSFADTYGYKIIQSSALILFIIQALIVYLIQTFAAVIVASVIAGMAISQNNGAFGSWFNNSYKLIVDDEDRKFFGITNAKLLNIHNVTRLLAFPLFGLIYSITQRKNLYLIFISLAFIQLVLVNKYMREYKLDSENNDQNNNSTENAVSPIETMKNTISLVFNNKHIFFWMIGVAIVISNTNVLYNGLIKPIVFESYLLNDFVIGIVSSILNGMVIFWNELVAKSNEVEFIQNNIERVFSGSVIIHYSFRGIFLILFLTFFNPTNYLNLFNIIILVVLLTSTIPFFYFFVNNLFKIQLDLYPNEMRNSIASLSNTIGTVLGAILAIAGSQLIQINLISGLIFFTSVSILGAMFIVIGYKSIPNESTISEEREEN